MIELERISKIFESEDGDAVVALSEVSLSVALNEFVAIVGRSGCDKSTLLRLVDGLVTPTSGRVSIAGAAVTTPRRDCGIVFQAPTLLPWASVFENVLFPFRVFGGLDDHVRGRPQAHLKLVGLNGFEKRKPRELSAGKNPSRSSRAVPNVSADTSSSAVSSSLRPRRRSRSHARTIVFPMLALALLILVWEAVVCVVLDPRIPAPGT
jgi:ABC-type taurine transport system ATPase subunit